MTKGRQTEERKGNGGGAQFRWNQNANILGGKEKMANLDETILITLAEELQYS